MYVYTHIYIYIHRCIHIYIYEYEALRLRPTTVHVVGKDDDIFTPARHPPYPTHQDSAGTVPSSTPTLARWNRRTRG